jgi:hypothetical protein
MIWKLILTLAAAGVLLGSLYFEVHQRTHGVLDSVKQQQVPKMRSAKTIHDYRQ